MNTDQPTYRPSELIEEWLLRYGYSKRRKPAPDAPSILYALVERWEPESEVWVRRWRVLDTDLDGSVALTRGVGTLMADLMKEAQDTKFPEVVAGLLMLIHGEAKVALPHPITGEPIEADPDDPEYAELFEKYPEMRERVKHGFAPLRMVSVVTPEGLASDLSVFFDTESEPMIETSEEWVHDGEGTVPSPRGVVDTALVQAMRYLMVLRETVRMGNTPSLEGLVETAMEMRKEGHPAGNWFTAFVLKLIATGLERGDIDFSDDDDDE